MKRIFLFPFLLILSYNSFAQADQPTTVYTCKGSNVAALIRAEYSSSDITYYTNYTSSQYSYLGITIIGNASHQYNCHSYAWHLTEGNSNRVWINNTDYNDPVNGCYPENNNIHSYWTDGCFIQVCNEADADKVHYYCGDHSAVASTSNPGLYESKWGGLALVRHARTAVPYADPTNSVNYYASTKMSGATTNLCTGTRDFLVKNISGATYSWTYSGTLSVVGPINSNQLTVQRNASSNGPGWVQVQISTPCSSAPVNVRTDFPVGTGVNSITFNRCVINCDAGPYLYANIAPVPGGTSCDWYYKDMSSASNPFVFLEDATWGTDWPLRRGNRYYTIRAVVTTPCGTLTGDYVVFAPSCTGGGARISVSPNPAKNNIAIQLIIEEGRLETDKNFGLVEIQISDKLGNVLLKRKGSSQQKIISIDVSTLRPDMYLIKVWDGVNWRTGQLIKQ